MRIASADTTGRTLLRKSSTGAAREESLVSPNAESEKNQSRWTDLIAAKLVAWELDPSRFDGEIVGPEMAAIRLGVRLAIHWRDRGNPAPTDIVPDGDGGLVFEFRDLPKEMQITVGSDCVVEILEFDGSRVVSRDRIT